MNETRIYSRFQITDSVTFVTNNSVNLSVNSYEATQEIPSIPWNPKSSIGPYLRQGESSPRRHIQFFKFHFNIVLSIPGSS